jgi:hypothetical protein
MQRCSFRSAFSVTFARLNGNRLVPKLQLPVSAVGEDQKGSGRAAQVPSCQEAFVLSS